MREDRYGAVVIGSGPNGYGAAVTMAQAGKRVLLVEGASAFGGGMRSCALTEKGFVHDTCASVFPLAQISPFFKELFLDCKWIYPPVALAHPFEEGRASLLCTSIEESAATLQNDGTAYIKLFKPLVASWPKLADKLLARPYLPPYSLALLCFAKMGLQSAAGFWQRRFQAEPARALFSGLAAHSMLSLDQPLSSAFALILGACAHLHGWPIVAGGSQKLADALHAAFLSFGGEAAAGWQVRELQELPPAERVFFDTGPRGLLKIAEAKLPRSYKVKLSRFRYGPGVFKIDWALSSPIPWKAKECGLAATVHVGGTSTEIYNSEKSVWENRHPEKPFVILVQPSLFDPSRAPKGKHTTWGYCHVPSNSNLDMTEAIERQVERFAPGFRDCILARSTKSAAHLETYNPNYVGGDINGGLLDLRQLLFRPTLISPYSTPCKGIYLCSSSTPPGGGVHGLCGFHAARLALSQSF